MKCRKVTKVCPIPIGSFLVANKNEKALPMPLGPLSSPKNEECHERET